MIPHNYKSELPLAQKKNSGIHMRGGRKLKYVVTKLNDFFKKPGHNSNISINEQHRKLHNKRGGRKLVGHLTNEQGGK